jgi:ferric-dicitrate binding protein FerR (iron transport regulator)
MSSRLRRLLVFLLGIRKLFYGKSKIVSRLVERICHPLPRGLKNEAASLNAQLAAEREQYSALETSFNRYETSQSSALAEKETELQAEHFRRKGVEVQRNIAVLAAAGLLVLYLVKLKFKIP